MPRFEWDELKNASNLAKHGVGFEEAKMIFEGPVLTSVDSRFDYAERREISIGAIGGLVAVVVVHTERHGSIRIISARLANRNERRRYDEHLRKAVEGTGSAV